MPSEHREHRRHVGTQQPPDVTAIASVTSTRPVSNYRRSSKRSPPAIRRRNPRVFFYPYTTPLLTCLTNVRVVLSTSLRRFSRTF